MADGRESSMPSRAISPIASAAARHRASSAQLSSTDRHRIRRGKRGPWVYHLAMAWPMPESVGEYDSARKVLPSYNRKLWMKRKGDVPFWGCAGDQPQVPGATRGERYATYAGAYHWTDDGGHGGDGPGHVG